MAHSQFTQDMKRCAVIHTLEIKHSPKFRFLKVIGKDHSSKKIVRCLRPIMEMPHQFKISKSIQNSRT